MIRIKKKNSTGHGMSMTGHGMSMTGHGVSVSQFVNDEVSQDVFGTPTYISQDRIIAKASRTVGFIGRFVELLHSKYIISDDEVLKLCNKSAKDFVFERDGEMMNTCCEKTKNLRPYKERFDEPHDPTLYEIQVFECVCIVCGDFVDIKDK